MPSLIVRNIDQHIADALKAQARARGVSAEAEHRRILEEALLKPPKRSFLACLQAMPDVGEDDDFTRQGTLSRSSGLDD